MTFLGASDESLEAFELSIQEAISYLSGLFSGAEVTREFDPEAQKMWLLVHTPLSVDEAHALLARFDTWLFSKGSDVYFHLSATILFV